MSEATTIAPVTSSAGATPPPITPSGAINAPVTPPVAPAAAVTPPASSTSGDWLAGFNDDAKGYVQNKQFKGPSDLLDSYRNLEKLHGAGPDKLIKLPDSMESPEARALFEKLGAPKDAKGYNFDAAKGADPKQAEFAAAAFHELGVPKPMAEKFFQKMTEFNAAKTAEATTAQTEGYKTQDSNLRKEWGAAFDQNRNIAAQAARNLGMTAAQVDALGATLGLDGVAKLLHKFGTATGEASFIAGTTTGSDIQSPEQARNTIKSLMQDTDFADKLAKGDVDARRRWDNAHKQAFQGEVNI